MITMENFLTNTDFAWFTKDSYLKYKNGKHQASMQTASRGAQLIRRTTDMLLTILRSLPTCWACHSSCLSFSTTTWLSTIPRGRNEVGTFSEPGFQHIVWGKVQGMRGLHTSFHPSTITTYKATTSGFFQATFTSSKSSLTFCNKELPLSRAHYRDFYSTSFPQHKNMDNFFFLNGKHHPGNTITTSFEVIDTVPLPLATSTQQAELHALTQACTLAKGKTSNSYTDSG